MTKLRQVLISPQREPCFHWLALFMQRYENSLIFKASNNVFYVVDSGKPKQMH